MMQPIQASLCCVPPSTGSQNSLLHACSLVAPPCSLAASSKAAMLPFPNGNGNPQS